MEKFLHPKWHKTFLGIRQQHTYWLYKVIDEILNEYQVEGIIEIGTGRGALSIFLGLECFQREFEPLITVDIVRPENVDRIFNLLNIRFIEKDIFTIEFTFDKPILLFCDGGNKAKEFNSFVPKLKSGSIIAVHDWERELSEKDIDTSLVEPIKQEEWNQSPDNIHTSFWRVK
jgi:hypothetical protein